MMSRMMRMVTIGAGVFTAALLVTLFVLRGIAGIYELGQPFPQIFGYSIDMRYVPPAEAPCHLIRITDDDCPYCREDQIEYGRLVAEAQHAGCRLTTIGPKTGDVALQPGTGGLQLQYIDMRLGRALDPWSTPQAILLDASRHVVWHRQGPITERQAERAMRKIAALR